jgi:endonuclease YncB( thermonuclease family)
VRQLTLGRSMSSCDGLRLLGLMAAVLALSACELDIDPMRTTPAAQEQIDAIKAGHIVGRANVIDGDTLQVRGQRIRLWGVDALESGQRCKNEYGQQWLCGKDAAMFLSLYIGPRTVLCEPRGKSYERVVARCTVGGEDLGAWTVSKGWALDYARYSKGAYTRQERAARAAGIGMHKGEHVAPWDWRKRPRD